MLCCNICPSKVSRALLTTSKILEIMTWSASLRAGASSGKTARSLEKSMGFNDCPDPFARIFFFDSFYICPKGSGMISIIVENCNIFLVPNSWSRLSIPLKLLSDWLLSFWSIFSSSASLITPIALALL